MNYDENINIQDKLQHLDQLKTIYLQNKKNLLLDTSFVEKYQENFLVQYTYDSTSIEGNTLTKEETYSLLIDNRTPSNKDILEIYEQINHKNAFQYMLSEIKANRELSESILCSIHKIVTQNILPGGIYRNVLVYIANAHHDFPQPDELPLLMKHFYSELESKTNICNLPESNHTPFELACWTHAKFVDLHPFRVGNGRTGRLIMNYQLIRYDYLPLSIPVEDKTAYCNYLDHYSCTGNLIPFVEYLIDLELKELTNMVKIEKSLSNTLESQEEQKNDI